MDKAAALPKNYAKIMATRYDDGGGFTRNTYDQELAGLGRPAAEKGHGFAGL